MRLTIKFISIMIIAIVFSSASLQGCGNNAVVTANSTISTSPTSISAAIGDTTSFDITVTVKYADGTPYPNAVLRIAGAFAEPRNSTNTLARYQFYYGPGGELGPNPLPVDSGFTAQTDDFGNYTFSITVYGTVGGTANAFSDNINIFSGSSFFALPVTIS